MNQNSNIRRIDELGRIVIPKDIRKKMHIEESELLEIFIDAGDIRIRKYDVIDDTRKNLNDILALSSRVTGNNYILVSKEGIISSSNPSFLDYPLDASLKVLFDNLKESFNYQINLFGNSYESNFTSVLIKNEKIAFLLEFNDALKGDNSVIKLLKHLIESF